MKFKEFVKTVKKPAADVVERSVYDKLLNKYKHLEEFCNLEGYITQNMQGAKSEEVIRHTCANCEYYHSTVIDPDDQDGYHFHDYCSVWRTHIPDYIIFDRLGYEKGFGDIECGIAGCWCFLPKLNGIVIKKFPDMSQNIKEDDHD